jgi:hypothetical protein
MSWKENLKQSQGGGANFLRLEPIIVFETKKKENAEESVFEYYNTKDEKRYQMPGPLAGVIIGRTMRLKYWDQPKEISYYSPDYFNHKEVVVFQSKSKTNKPVFKGPYDEAVKFFGGRPNQKQIIYVATAKGLYAVTANLTLSIDQFNQAKDTVLENEVNLFPCLYTGKESFVTKKCKDILAKVSLTNKPSFVRIEKKQPITDEMAVAYHLDELSALFKDFREQVTGSTFIQKPEEDLEAEDMNFDKKEAQVRGSINVQTTGPVDVPVTDQDDLPF